MGAGITVAQLIAALHDGDAMEGDPWLSLADHLERIAGMLQAWVVPGSIHCSIYQRRTVRSVVLVALTCIASTLSMRGACAKAAA